MQGIQRTQHTEKPIITGRSGTSVRQELRPNPEAIEAYYREGNGAWNRDAIRKLTLARECEVLPDQCSPVEIRQNERNSRTETCPTILQTELYHRSHTDSVPKTLSSARAHQVPELGLKPGIRGCLVHPPRKVKSSNNRANNRSHQQPHCRSTSAIHN